MFCLFTGKIYCSVTAHPPSPQLNPAFASLLPITNLCIHLPLILSIFSPIIQPAQHDIPINHYRSVHPPGFVWFWDTTWWKCVAYRETRAVLLSDEKPVQCRDNAPLVVDTQIFFFLILVYHQSSLTCYITLTHDFPPPWLHCLALCKTPDKSLKSFYRERFRY